MSAPGEREATAEEIAVAIERFMGESGDIGIRVALTRVAALARNIGRTPADCPPLTCNHEETR